MTFIITKEAYCPLCDNPMRRRNVLIKDKQATVFFCKPCDIGIFDFDPAFKKWRDTDKDIPCGVCGFGKLKWFARYIDGFFKAKCPKCRTVFKSDVDVRFGKGGNIIIPEEMIEEEDKEEPIRLEIPLSHLEKKFGKDKINEFKNKRRHQA